MNAEKEGVAAAKKYKVTGFPTILFLNGAGEVEGSIIGYKPADGFAQDVTKFVDSHRELPALEARAKSNPTDAVAAERLASIYAGRGRADKAEAMLARAAKLDPENARGGLAAAYSAVGDYYQNAEKFDRAVPLFQSALKVAKKPYDRAYANMSIAACYLSQQNLKSATPYLQAVAGQADAPAEFKDQAKQMLQAVKQQGGKE